MSDRHHEAYEKLLYLKDEELSERQYRRLRRHLRTCTACREEAAAIRMSLARLQTTIRTGSGPHPSSGLHARILAAVRTDELHYRAAGDSARQRRMSLAMAGAVLLITCSFVFQGMSGMLKMQRFEAKLHRRPRAISSLAVISSLRKTASSQQLSGVRLSLAGQKPLLDIIRPYLESPQRTVTAAINNSGGLLTPALLSRITAHMTGPAAAGRGL